MNSKKEFYKNQAASIITTFDKRGFEGYYCEDSQAAVELAMGLMKENAVVTWGGSMTLEETGMIDALKDSTHTVIDRSLAKTAAEKTEYFRKSVCADYYYMSTNAITLDGELINIDGNGNRVACLINGPDNVIILSGMNKVVLDERTGLDRVRNIAAPPNGNRLQLKTPCSYAGKCKDCYTDDCMCSQLVVTRRSKAPGRIKIILIGEELGY